MVAVETMQRIMVLRVDQAVVAVNLMVLVVQEIHHL